MHGLECDCGSHYMRGPQMQIYVHIHTHIYTYEYQSMYTNADTLFIHEHTMAKINTPNTQSICLPACLSTSGQPPGPCFDEIDGVVLLLAVEGVLAHQQHVQHHPHTPGIALLQVPRRIHSVLENVLRREQLRCHALGAA